MSSLPLSLESLTAAWKEHWPETPPIAFLLRGSQPDRWVRFHSLPDSKRYAETESEYATVLSRHHAVLDALGASPECLVIQTRFSSEPSDGLEVPNESEHWRTIDHADYFEEPVQLFVSALVYPSAEFDDVLLAAADWKVANVIVGPTDLGWLYHPYDGGADVIASSREQRDQLKADFAAWLSEHPEGL